MNSGRNTAARYSQALDSDPAPPDSNNIDHEENILVEGGEPVPYESLPSSRSQRRLEAENRARYEDCPSTEPQMESSYQSMKGEDQSSGGPREDATDISDRSTPSTQAAGATGNSSNSIKQPITDFTVAVERGDKLLQSIRQRKSKQPQRSVSVPSSRLNNMSISEIPVSPESRLLGSGNLSQVNSSFSIVTDTSGDTRAKNSTLPSSASSASPAATGSRRSDEDGKKNDKPPSSSPANRRSDESGKKDVKLPSSSPANRRSQDVDLGNTPLENYDKRNDRASSRDASLSLNFDSSSSPLKSPENADVSPSVAKVNMSEKRRDTTQNEDGDLSKMAGKIPDDVNKEKPEPTTSKSVTNSAATNDNKNLNELAASSQLNGQNVVRSKHSNRSTYEMRQPLNYNPSANPDSSAYGSIRDSLTRDEEKEALRKMKVHFAKAKLKERQQKYEEASDELQQALRYEIQAKGETNLEVAKTYEMLGRNFSRIQQKDSAVEHLEKALMIYQDIGLTEEKDSETLWKVHDYLAQAYDSVKDGTQEIDHYTKAIDILTRTTVVPPERLAHMHNNLGNAHHKAGDMNKAKEHLEKAKEMMELLYLGENNEGLSKVHSSLGDVYKDLMEDDKAIAELERSIRIREELGTVKAILGCASNHNTLAEIYTRQNKAHRAEYHKKKASEPLQKMLHGTVEERDQYVAQLMEDGHGFSGSKGMIGQLAAGLIAPDDIAKAQQLQQMGRHKEAIYHYEKAIKTMEELDSQMSQSDEIQSVLAMCHNNVGNDYRQISIYEKAENHLLRALEIRRKIFGDEPSDDTASTMFNLGHLYNRRGGPQHVKKAVDLHEECLQMYMRLGGPAKSEYKRWIISLYRSLGSGYESLGNHWKSINNYEDAKRIIAQDVKGDPEELRAICNNLGNSYESIKDYKKAEENLRQSLDIARNLEITKPNDTQLQNHIAACLNNLGVMYQTKGELEKSHECLEESKNLRQKLSGYDMEALQDLPSSLHNLGNTLMKLGKLNEALDCYKQERQTLSNLGEDTIDVDMTISDVYTKLGRHSEAEAILGNMSYYD